MHEADYEGFLRSRITELRLEKNISEHKMSLDLGKSGSYIRSITSGVSLPSLRELFNIIMYFNMTPAEFFFPLDANRTPYAKLYERILHLENDDLEKVGIFIDWITK